MFLFALVTFVGSVVFGAVPALADRPTPSEIIRQMKATLEPDRPSVRQITIT